MCCVTQNLSLYASISCIMTHRWPSVTRDRDNKAYTHTIHIYLPFTRKSKRLRSKDVEIVGAEISLMNSVLVRFKCLWSVDSVDRRHVHHRKCENAKPQVKIHVWMKRNRSCVLKFPVVLIIPQVLVTTISLHLI